MKGGFGNGQFRQGSDPVANATLLGLAKPGGGRTQGGSLLRGGGGFFGIRSRSGSKRG